MKITLHITRQQSPFKDSGEATEQKLVLEANSPAELHQGIDEVFGADHATGLRELLGLRAEAGSLLPAMAGSRATHELVQEIRDFLLGRPSVEATLDGSEAVELPCTPAQLLPLSEAAAHCAAPSSEESGRKQSVGQP